MPLFHWNFDLLSFSILNIGSLFLKAFLNYFDILKHFIGINFERIHNFNYNRPSTKHQNNKYLKINIYQIQV